MLTEVEIGGIIWAPGVNSHTRAPVLIKLLQRAECDEEFWRIFQFGWNDCDDTWPSRGDFTNLLRFRGSAGPYLSGDDKAFFNALPDPVTVYRGCSTFRVRGLAWTTELTIAQRFAKGHRGISVPDAVIATATIPKHAIFTVSAERNEYEVILNWRRLRNLDVKPYD